MDEELWDKVVKNDAAIYTDPYRKGKANFGDSKNCWFLESVQVVPFHFTPNFLTRISLVQKPIFELYLLTPPHAIYFIA